MDTTRPDLFVHRLIERLGPAPPAALRRAGRVVERLVNLARFGELAAADMRRAPRARPESSPATSRPSPMPACARRRRACGDRAGGVQVMTMHAAKGLEFDHVYVLGLQSRADARRRRRTLEPIPDALLKDGTGRLPRRPRRRDAPAAPRRDDARAASGSCSPSPTRPRAAQRSPVAVRRGGARGRRRASGRRARRSSSGRTRACTRPFRILRDEVLESVSRVGGRLGEMRLDTDLDISHAIVRYLELIKLAALIERAAARGRHPRRCRRSTRACCRR